MLIGKMCLLLVVGYRCSGFSRWVLCRQICCFQGSSKIQFSARVTGDNVALHQENFPSYLCTNRIRPSKKRNMFSVPARFLFYFILFFIFLFYFVMPAICDETHTCAWRAVNQWLRVMHISNFPMQRVYRPYALTSSSHHLRGKTVTK